MKHSKGKLAKFGREIRREWLLEEDIRFLNHGSFGAAPKVVLSRG